MSVTHIVPTTHAIYWFVDLGASVISGITEPGLVTTTKFDIKQSKDEKILVAMLEEIQHKLKEDGHGFCLRDGSVVFSRLPFDALSDLSDLSEIAKA
jgi:hypothetical protein